MTVVINKLFQPLAYQTASGAGLHLPPRGRIEVPDSEISEELRRAATRGFVVLQAVDMPTAEPLAKTKSAATGKKEG